MIFRSDNLVKTYGQRTVVNKVSIHVDQGEIVGLLGPNGAGKTTTFYMMVGFIRPAERSRISATGTQCFQKTFGRRQYYGRAGNDKTD